MKEQKEWLNRGILSVLFLIVVCAPMQYGLTLKGIHFAFVDPLIWGVFGMFAIQSILVRNIKQLLPTLEIVIFFLCIIGSIFVAGDKKLAIKELLQYIEYFYLIYILFNRFAFTKEQLKKMYITISGVSALIILLATVQYFIPSIDVFKIKATFGNVNVYNGFLAIVFPLLLAGVIYLKDSKWRIALILTLVLGGITLLSGAVFFAVVASISTILFFQSQKQAFILLGCLIVFCTVVWPHLPRHNVVYAEKSIRLFDDEKNITPRYAEWDASLDMIKEYPWLGVGLGNYQTKIGEYYGLIEVKEGPKEPDHNNLFLVTLAGSGILGLIGLLTLLLLWGERLITCVQNATEKYAKLFALGAFGALIAFCITSIWHALLIRGICSLFVIIIALGTREVEGTKEELSTSDK